MELDAPFRFEDEDESTEYDYEPDVKLTRPDPSILLDRDPLDYLVVDMKNYNFQSWEDVFPTHIDLLKLVFRREWREIIHSFSVKAYYPKLEEELNKHKKNMVPPPELVFTAINICPIQKIRVLIIGQDPYVQPFQAMGLSFSVPVNLQKPPSLNTIYQNLFDHGHFKSIPKSGSLAGWALQGCLMLNTALTTELRNCNAHKSLWREFTEDLIRAVSEKCDSIVVLAWGKEAHELCFKCIDVSKHRIITSSHPSPKACDKPLNGYKYDASHVDGRKKPEEYPAFSTVDHFGLTNEYLVKMGKKPIIWDMIR